MLADDWDSALKLAARFPRLGPQESDIRKAANAINNPTFYRQIGQDVELLKLAGIAALKTRFEKSWQRVQLEKGDTEKKGR